MTEQNTSGLREYFKKWPKLYYLIAGIFGPMQYGGLSSQKFLNKYKTEGLKLNLGSGPRRISPNIKNVDLFPYQGVDIVANIENLPLDNDSVSQIICDNVLEHVAEPNKVVGEMHRILQSGGLAYIATPFLYPYHLSPNDYNRWTKDGLIELFNEFEVVEIGTRCGPFSVLAVYLNYLFATIFSFGSDKLYWLLLDLSIFIFFPIKLPDLIFNHWPNSVNMASVLYCVIRKK